MLSLLPPSFHPLFLSCSLSPRPDEPQLEEDLFRWCSMLGGVMLVTSIKYCGKNMDTMGIMEIENGLRVDFNCSENTLTAESSIVTFIVAFSYNLLRLSKENTLCKLVH